MNIYCNPLTLTIPPLRDGYDITKVTVPHLAIDVADINPEIKEILFKLGITVEWAEIFYRMPGAIGYIHSDLKAGDFTKINWIYKGNQSIMTWYTVNDADVKYTSGLTSTDTKYIRYSSDDVTFAYSTNILGPALVQVGAPHTVINPVEDRYCVCLCLSDLHGKRLTMAESQNLLQDYIIASN